MDVPRRFADSPAKGRGHRFLFHPGFPEALAFQRILLTAEKADLSCLNEWQALYEQQAAQKAPRPPRPEQADVPEGAETPRDAEEDENDRPRRHSRRRRPRRGTAGREAGGEPHAVTVTEDS